MWGFSESQFSAFALVLYNSEPLAGLVSTIPQVLGTALSLVSPWAVRRLGSHKRWIVIAAASQACVFIPLIVGALVGWMPIGVLFLLITLYFAAAWSAGTTWTTFIATLVHPRLRARYFGRRIRFNNLASVAATFLAGAIIGAGQHADPDQSPSASQNGTDGLVWKFAIVFALAAVARGVSTCLIAAQHEPTPLPANHRELSVRQFAQTLRASSAGRLITYILAAQLAVQFSTPFIPPFLLEQAGLKHDFTLFGVVMAVQLVAKALFMPVWGRLAHAHGPHTLLRVGALLIVPQPLLWMLPPHTPVILALQVSSGAATAAFELGIFLMLMRHIDDSVRTSIMARYQLLVTTTSVLGSLVGAGVLERLAHGHAAYMALFLFGSVARLCTLPLFFRTPVDPIADMASSGSIAVELHPGPGMTDQPIAASAVEPPHPEPSGASPAHSSPMHGKP